LAGEITFDDAGKQLYINWYIEQDTALSAGKPAIEDTRFAGYCERRATHLQKLMILCSASRGDDLKITGGDFKRALQLLTEAESRMHKTFGGLGKSRVSDESDTVINFIKNIKTTTRKMVLQKFYRDIDPMTLSNVEVLMQQMGVVKITLLPQQADKLYTWIGD
jgi:hypothetical protein